MHYSQIINFTTKAKYDFWEHCYEVVSYSVIDILNVLFTIHLSFSRVFFNKTLFENTKLHFKTYFSFDDQYSFKRKSLYASIKIT